MLIPDWTAGEPGVFATVEKLCSGWAIEARLRQDGYAPEDSLLFRADPAARKALGARDLAKAARNGDPFARAEIRKVAESFGAALVNVLSLTSVERIAVGGGVSAGREPAGAMRVGAGARFMPGPIGFRSSAMEGETVVLVGALLRAAELVRLRCDQQKSARYDDTDRQSKGHKRRLTVRYLLELIVVEGELPQCPV